MGNRLSLAESSRFAQQEQAPPPDIQPLIVRCRGEVYIFIYTDQTRDEAMRWAGRHASNPDLNFTWADSSIVSKVARDLARKEATR